MAKKRRPMTHAAKTRLMVFGTLSVIFLFSFAFSLIKYSANLYGLTREKDKLAAQYLELQEEEDDLKIEITKLRDPEYLAKFARENYLYSKEGELIIKINETKKGLNDTQSQLNNNESVLFVSGCLIALIFVYIIVRSQKKKKSNV